MRDERQYVIDAIGAFLNGSSADHDWDDFTSCSLHDLELDSIRRRAGALDLPLDAEGEAILKALRTEAEFWHGVDLTKPKPWRTEAGMICGLALGALLWGSSYVPGAGLFQNFELILFPTAMGILVVTLRNKRKKVGPYDPEIIAQNKRGRV
jgi:hypothetical protein